MAFAGAHLEKDSPSSELGYQRILRPRISSKSEITQGRNDFANIVYVGDGSWDVVAARKLRIGFVGVNAGRNQEAFAECRVPIVAGFEQPLDFMRLLDSVTAAIG